MVCDEEITRDSAQWKTQENADEEGRRSASRYHHSCRLNRVWFAQSVDMFDLFRISFAVCLQRFGARCGLTAGIYEQL